MIYKKLSRMLKKAANKIAPTNDINEIKQTPTTDNATTLTFRYTDYVRLKKGRYQSVGKFGDDIYAYEIATGIADSPEYHQISREEFDSFESWGQQEEMDMKKFYEIKNRPVLCSGYLGREYMDMSKLWDR